MEEVPIIILSPLRSSSIHYPSPDLNGDVPPAQELESSSGLLTSWSNTEGLNSRLSDTESAQTLLPLFIAPVGKRRLEEDDCSGQNERKRHRPNHCNGANLITFNPLLGDNHLSYNVSGMFALYSMITVDSQYSAAGFGVEHFTNEAAPVPDVYHEQCYVPYMDTMNYCTVANYWEGETQQLSDK